MTGSNLMAGKTCVVTGATSGIGEVAALELAKQGGKIILVGRSREKCEASTMRIREESGNPDVEWMLADLSSRFEICRLAAEIRECFPRLDVLINNAGAMFATRQMTVDRIERTFALNHLAYFLLSNLLLPLLKSSSPARIINVASDAHRVARKGLDFEDLESKKSYKPFPVYGRTKLANILFTNELARRLEGTGVTANCLHPGFVATNFTTGDGWLFWVMNLAAKVVAISPENGARTTAYLASSPEVEGHSGGYYVKSHAAVPTMAARDSDAARRLWEISEVMTGLIAPSGL